MWTRGGGGRLERAVSVPDRGPATHRDWVRRRKPSSRAPACPAPPGRGSGCRRSSGPTTRSCAVAPITNTGELLGMIVVRRPEGALGFDENDDQALTELARQVGLALHNVKLDSALQESLDEVRRQADELRASRARIVEAGDAQRRRIERDLHDGAQQHLVALAVSVNLVRQIAENGSRHRQVDARADRHRPPGGGPGAAQPRARYLPAAARWTAGLAEALSAAAGPCRAPHRRRGRGHRAVLAGGRRRPSTSAASRRSRTRPSTPVRERRR